MNSYRDKYMCAQIAVKNLDLRLLNWSFREPVLFWLRSKGLEDSEAHPGVDSDITRQPTFVEDLGGEEMVDFASEEVSCWNQWLLRNSKMDSIPEDLRPKFR